MKRLFTLFLVLLAALSLVTLVSCGSSQETASTSDSTPTSSTVTPTAITPQTSPPPETTAPEEPVKLMTFNLRYDTTSHSCLSLDVRGPHLLEIVKKYMPDSISFCEATNDWMNYLRVEIEKIGYGCVGVGRDSGKTGSNLKGSGNEHTPIFYQTEKYELLESDTFWLSVTPAFKGTVSWDSSCHRICTYAVLKNKESGSVYAHFGTHLDHASEEARYNGVLVIETYIRSVLEKYGDIGIVLSGDFNDTNTSFTYKTITSFMDDSKNLAKKKLVVGSTTNGYTDPIKWENTYSTTQKPTVSKSNSPIDYIFLSKKTASVSLYTVLDDLFTFEYNGMTWTNHPVSDHYGVYCEAAFTNPSQTMMYDESKLVAYTTTVTPSQTLPSNLVGMPIITNCFKVSSSLPAIQPIGNLLNNDSSVASVRVAGEKHGFWEITLTTDEITYISGISLSTGKTQNKLPSILRIFISEDGKNWKRFGKICTDELTTSTSYYVSAKNSIIRVTQIKIVFTDCSNMAELANLTVYGR